ncbi:MULTISPECIES: hypothetical protein [unclassified Anabaena]|uniref:hypothetical protein n=1 Tax=unclassified Anabaena TaxID=2619674 RepID=UPI0008325CE4|nr:MULTISPECIES: hypothetical protein [unclassified Anabaena]
MKPVTRSVNYYLWLLAGGFWLLVVSSWHHSAFTQALSPKPSLQSNRGEKSVCSQQNIETLTTQLLRDLPSYANRASQRGRRLRRSSDVYSYMLVAGRPEFQPLPLQPIGQEKSTNQNIEQVFFTTLERQYIDTKVVELQQFHRLLLTKTPEAWQFVIMFTQTGSYPKQQPPTPPRDSSNGSVAQGIKTWLRDCQAGTVRNPKI